MKNNIPNGVWPTMITPYTKDGNIDYGVLANMVEWYIERGVDGLFAVCQSSEMFFLTLKERISLASEVKKIVNGRIPVIASGHISETISDQIEEVKAIADTGVDAVVLIGSRLASESESDSVFKKNTEYIMNTVPGIPLGIYECPFPYKRVLTPELTQWCSETGRFLFLKDTCRDSELIRQKIDKVSGDSLKVFNANAATILKTLKRGAAGYSGVMANFQPRLYKWLMEHWIDQPKEAEKLQKFLGLTSTIEYQWYPVNAKYFMKLEGLGIELSCRSREESGFDKSHRLEVEYLRDISRDYERSLVL